jgi:tetratricopeptide (TPR) repeat protein
MADASALIITQSFDVQAALAEAEQLSAQGRIAEAEARCREIVAHQPGYAPAWARLAFLAFGRGQLAEAVAGMEKCVSLEPGFALHWRNLCELRRRAGMGGSAVAAGRRAVDLAPADPEAFHNLSLALGDSGQTAEAVACVRRLLEIAPQHGRGWNNLGHWLTKQGRWAEARDAFARASSLEPGNAEARANLARAEEVLAKSDGTATFAQTMATALRHWREGRFEEALAGAREAIALEPRNVEALGLCATCLSDLGRAAEALEAAERALEVDPTNPSILMTLAFAQIDLGHWKEGWKNYELRFLGAHEVKTGQQTFRKIPLPQWTGQGGTEQQSILVVHEQGFGDFLQFCRFLILLKQRFARVDLLAPPEMARLVEASFGADVAVISIYPADYAVWDWHSMMMSLPYAFGTELDTLPAPPSYLSVYEPARRYWGRRLQQLAGAKLKVGLSWTGRPSHRFNAQRSMPFEALGPILGVEGVAFVCLQRREDVAKAPVIPAGVTFLDLMGEMTDFSTTAALIDNLDLVISVDSVIVHLAAALGRPVFMMNRANSEWRWMGPREDSPWYPSMRIFRQPELGDWREPVERAAEALKGLAAGGAPKS